MGRANSVRCSHAKFFKACEALRENKDRFIDSGLSVPAAATLLSQIVGFAISPSTLGEVRLATGIMWDVKLGTKGKKKGSITWNALKTLSRAVENLYARLGEPCPEGVAKLIEHFAAKPLTTEPKIGE